MCGCSRFFSTTITCAAAPACRCREPIAQFIETQLGPSDMLGADVSAAGGVVGADDARSRHDHSAASAASSDGRATTRRATRWRSSTRTIRPRRSSASAIRSRCRRSKGSSSHMGSLKEGRKALILVSEGYSDTLPPQLRDPIAALPGFGNPDRGNPRRRPQRARPRIAGSFSPTARMQLSLRDVWDIANKNNVAIYAVDPRGLPVSEFDSEPAGGQHPGGSPVSQRDDGHAADAGRARPTAAPSSTATISPPG